MVYKLINSKRLIGDIFENYNIDYSGFVSRVPNYIHSAMKELGIFTTLISETVDAAVVDYKCDIPNETHVLEGVSYLGFRLPRHDTMNVKDINNIPNRDVNTDSYELDNNGHIITTFEKCDLGDLKFYIKKLPVEFDTITDLYFPLIPDNEDLFIALKWYILRKLLERGHKVGQFSLSANNIYLNPGLAWDKYSKIAKNSVSKLDGDDRHNISIMLRTFLSNYNYKNNEQFNIEI
jgi:hypothetical protein